jgi:hypothetical protein
MSFNLNDYVDVKTRVSMFHDHFPDGSLQFIFKGICDHDPEYVWGIAYAYRDQDDVRPGVGTAQELAIGRTNFTKGSVIQNLESSCWGRAIASLGIGIDTAVASRDDVQNVQNTEPRKLPTPTKQGKPFANDPMTQAQRTLIERTVPSKDWINKWKSDYGIEGPLTKLQASAMIEDLQALKLNKAITETPEDD